MLSHLREDGDLLHLYLYHFLYETGEPIEVEVALPGAGAVHRIDAWSGDVRPHAGVRHDGDRTLVTVPLAPGETALLTLDRSARGGRGVRGAPETVAEIAEWAIAVESWDAGELQLITEDRGLGYETREVRPTDGGHPARRRHRERCARGRTSPRSVPRSPASASTRPRFTSTRAAERLPLRARPRLDRRRARLRSGQRRPAKGFDTSRRPSTSPPTCGPATTR